MTRRSWMILGPGMVLLLVAAGTLWAYRQRPLSDAQIKQRFGCERATLDWRVTDVYCENPELYREHVRAGRDITTVKPGGGVSVCGDANYTAITPGLNQADVTRLLGEPAKKRVKNGKDENFFSQGDDEVKIKEGWIYHVQDQAANAEMHFGYDGRVLSKGCGNG